MKNFKILAYLLIASALLYLGVAYPKSRPEIPIEISKGVWVSENGQFFNGIVFAYGIPFRWLSIWMEPRTPDSKNREEVMRGIVVHPAGLLGQTILLIIILVVFFWPSLFKTIWGKIGRKIQEERVH